MCPQPTALPPSLRSALEAQIHKKRAHRPHEMAHHCLLSTSHTITFSRNSSSSRERHTPAPRNRACTAPIFDRDLSAANEGYKWARGERERCRVSAAGRAAQIPAPLRPSRRKLLSSSKRHLSMLDDNTELPKLPLHKTHTETHTAAAVVCCPHAVSWIYRYNDRRVV